MENKKSKEESLEEFIKDMMKTANEFPEICFDDSILAEPNKKYRELMIIEKMIDKVIEFEKEEKDRKQKLIEWAFEAVKQYPHLFPAHIKSENYESDYHRAIEIYSILKRVGERKKAKDGEKK